MQDEETDLNHDLEMHSAAAVARTCLLSPPRSQKLVEAESASVNVVATHQGQCKPNCGNRCLLRSSSISASRCIEE